MLFRQAAFAQTQETAGFEQVRAFDVTIDAAKDGSLKVIEKIEYDYGTNQRHGIFRDIPYRYSRSIGTYSLRIDFTSVTDEKGGEVPYTSWKSGGFQHVKIGDKNTTITGVHTYVLTYNVRRAINFFSDHEELYWNVTGTDWGYPIQQASAVITMPTALKEADLVCYTGVSGSTATNCAKRLQTDGSAIFIAQSLKANEGLTFAIRVPKGTFQALSRAEVIRDFIIDNWVIVLVPIAWWFIHLNWRKRGRDPKGRGTIVPEYEAPDKLTPAMLGTVWDGRAGMQEIASTIIDLAVRGFLKIKDLGNKKYEFTKLLKSTTMLNAFETKLVEGMFKLGSGDTVNLDQLKNKFYSVIPELEGMMRKELVVKGFYTSDPLQAQIIYAVPGVLLLVGPWIIALGEHVFSIITALSLSLIGLTLFIYSWVMPQMTVAGAQLRERIQGFKWFLSVTETERLKFHNAPEKKPEQFQALLPYAMILGVEKQWAGQFASMAMQPPQWYSGTPGSAFNALLFANAMSSFRTDTSSMMTSRPSSAGSGTSGFGGGGFSGGGFGGGGGGSW